MEKSEELVLRWQGRSDEAGWIITVEICECKDKRFRIHLTKAPLISSGDGRLADEWWDLTEPYRNVDDAKRDGVALAKHHFQINIEPKRIKWEFFGAQDVPRWAPSRHPAFVLLHGNQVSGYRVKVREVSTESDPEEIAGSLVDASDQNRPDIPFEIDTYPRFISDKKHLIEILIELGTHSTDSKISFRYVPNDL